MIRLRVGWLETRQGQKYVFSKSTRPALGPTLPPIQWVAGSFPGVKRPGRDVHHSPLSTAEVNIPILSLYTFMDWTGTILPFLNLEGGRGSRVVIRIVIPRLYV